MHRYYEALSLELLVILAATFLLIWIHQEGVVRCKRFGQVIGYIVLLISILMMGCTLYNAIWGKKKDFLSTCSTDPRCNLVRANSEGLAKSVETDQTINSKINLALSRIDPAVSRTNHRLRIRIFRQVISELA